MMLKKFIIPFALTLAFLSLLFVSVTSFLQVQEVSKERDAYKQKTANYEKKYTEIQDLLTVVTPETFQEKVASGEKMYVYIGRPDCSDCSSLDPKLVQYIKDHPGVEKKLLFVNVRLLREDEVKWQQFAKEYGVIGTPHFALWENGKQVLKSEWTKETGYTIDMFDTWSRKTGLVA